jgi:Tol biopolymer transport system component
MGHPEQGAGILSLSLETDPPKTTRLVPSPFDELWPAISPDGRHLAYSSNKTRVYQVYVQPYPALDSEKPVSIEGGLVPMWHPQGSSIFFRDLNGRLMEAEISIEPELDVKRPKVVLERPQAMPGNTTFHGIAPDGRRFLIVKYQPVQDVTELIVVKNWFEELKRKAPTGN